MYWIIILGNYVMHRPPGMYPNAFGKAPSPMECVNIPVMPAPVVVNEMSMINSEVTMSLLQIGWVGKFT